ncbi:YIP1 family protein [Halobacteria archaeon AArc-m2/3/4]|uniref:YIP1 family protein n=1 Tax=Natronoglomus mannanivorans TaxID=2979990 RepID=A0AAP2YV93_9EURY|nr:YIP1 family protein [Halobacteria archaeon AArc-xg1-1]MCU4971745.1 YIP1 family protein [Halobacteria archaeon AArc-m2/3/4]
MSLHSAYRTVRQFVLRPRQFFRRSSATSAAAGFVVVLALAIALTASVWYLGVLLAESTDATVTMDNPERPPDWVCEQHADDPDSAFGSGCDQPETVERDVGSLLREAASEYVGLAFFGTLFIWPIAGGVLFVAARTVGGTGGFLATLGVAGWGALPEFLRLAAGLAGLQYALGRTEFTEPFESFPTQLEAALASIQLPLLAVSLLVLVWQWSVLTAGLEEVHDLPRGVAAVAAGIPLALWGVLFLA